MTKMTDAVLNLELDNMTHDATGNNATFIRENEELLDRYEGNPYGDEKPLLSKVVSNDVQDVIESDMPTHARVFLGPGEVLKFKPLTGGDEAKKEAEQKTQYVNWQIFEQDWSFSVIHGFIKNAEIQKVSVVKYYIQETTEVTEHKKTGLSDEELALYEESLNGEDVESVEVDRQEENDKGENSIIFKVKRTTKPVIIKNVELENFRMTRNASSKDDAQIVGDVSLMTRGELLSMGFDRDLISSISLSGEIQENSRLKDIRDRAEGGDETTDVIQSYWAGEEVEIEDLYVQIDYDDDGIAERRHVMRSAGDEVILVNEVFNHVPYATMSTILMPHKAIGKSRAEVTAPTAKIKTAILRGVNNNITAVNNPRIAANKNVHMDDLLTSRINGVIRTKNDSNPGQNMFAIQIPYIGDKALQVVQYWDQARAQTTGSLLASQGLNADDLGKETATRFEGIKDASGAKTELVVRVMAETGFRQLFEGIAWLDSNFQDTETEIQVLGKELRIKPSDWKFRQSLVSKVGLGAGDDDKQLQTMTAFWQLSTQLKTEGSLMTDDSKRYNILEDMVSASGQPDISEYFNNPEQPQETIVAQNEQMQAMIQQLQQQVQQLQNPLAEAEKIKQEAFLLKAQSDADLKLKQMVEDQRQFNEKMAADVAQSNKDIAVRITDLEVKAGKDLSVQTEDNIIQ